MLVGIDFALNSVPRPAGAISPWSSSLDHEVGNDSMKRQAIVKSRVCKCCKVSDGARCITIEEVNVNVTFACFDDSFGHGSLFLSSSKVVNSSRLKILLQLGYNLFCEFAAGLHASQEERVGRLLGCRPKDAFSFHINEKCRTAGSGSCLSDFGVGDHQLFDINLGCVREQRIGLTRVEGYLKMPPSNKLVDQKMLQSVLHRDNINKLHAGQSCRRRQVRGRLDQSLSFLACSGDRQRAKRDQNRHSGSTKPLHYLPPLLILLNR